ncbi:putative nuclear RNA export factor SDE5 isoform X2 [Amaranthus tricolor]|uniref:putative nuclear RNA export factor SDE5 isoform X2 n=1 Tax=Amaranthus tricolor TaxID=29722 RepID=UPI00258EE701|nr:putative nuclear RNA export factor SDE5 isoform X2 [Amaranthus tricolor]
MEGPMVTRKHDHGDKSLKFLLDTFGSSFSIGEIASAFCNAGRDVNVAGEILRGMQTVPSADGTRLTKASKLKTSPASMSTISTVGKSCVWRVVGSNGTSNGTMPLELGAASVDTGSSDGKNYVWRAVGSNGTSNGKMPLKVGAALVDTSSSDGENYVWRVVGSNGTSNGTMPVKVGAASVNTSSSDGKNYVWHVVGSNGTSNGTNTMPLKVGAASVDTGSSDGKNYVWRVVGSNGTSNETMPQKVGVASVDTGSSDGDGKNYVWRVVGSNGTSNGTNTMPLKVGAASVDTGSSVGKNYVWRVAASSKTSNGTMPIEIGETSVAISSTVGKKAAGTNETPNGEQALKVKAASVVTSSSVREKNCFWSVVGSNGTRDGKRPLKVEANGFHVPVKTSDKPLLSRDADLGLFETSSSESNPSSDDHMEKFLFDMFGHGFQLERSTIREMLGQCGYDMKKSLEALLDLTAVTLDRRNNLLEGRHVHSNSKNLSSSSRIQKQAYAISNGCSTMRSNEKYDRQEESLSAVFPAPEQRDLSFSASIPGSATSSCATRVVIEPVKDIAGDFKAKTTMSHLDKLKDVVEEGSYNTLRKAVKEHRETMKKYYKDAAEAFARGDRDQALALLEKGQFFYKKAREADEESVAKIFETSTGDDTVEDEVSLDLQDHNVKEAIQLVKLHLRTLSGIPFVRNLKILIGNGDRDVKKLKRLIFKLLDKEGISWIEDEKCGTILIRLDEINPKTLSFGRKVCQI